MKPRMITPRRPVCPSCGLVGPHSPAGRSPSGLFLRLRCRGCESVFRVFAVLRIEERDGLLVVLDGRGERALASVTLRPAIVDRTPGQ